jgi:transcriptional regulator GlxA family with amidase domain
VTEPTIFVQETTTSGLFDLSSGTVSTMLSVALPALSGTASISTAGLMDALVKADASIVLTPSENHSRLFAVDLVGLNRRPVRCRDGIYMQPSIVATKLPIPDLVVVPGLDDDLNPSLEANRAWVPWIARWHASGSRVASSCTGAFLLAEAGVLAGKAATTHWLFAEEMRRRYPSVDVRADRMIIDTGDVITSGGATAFLNLVLYLVERFGGHERASMAAKILLIDGYRPSQLPYVAALPDRSHSDSVVHEVQAHIDAHLDEPLRIKKLATQFGLSDRTLTRRFVTATGRTPLAYLQYVRINHAKRLLETTSDSIESICRATGYLDPAAFRRAFKQITAMSPTGYRRAYSPRLG